MKGWLRFAGVQLVMLIAAVLGVFLLIPFCLAQAWVADEKSIKDGRVIDRWKWRLLNLVYGNPEDGPSGLYAKVWLNGTTEGPYMPNANPMWRAYVWSAWRNSCNNLKYVFAWKGGPFFHWENAKHTFYFQAGFYASGAPVLSAGRI